MFNYRKISRMSFASLFVSIALLLIGCATVTQPTVPIPLRQDMQIVAPEPTLPSQIKGFLGRWFGVWDRVMQHILVVEQINPPNATVIYAYGKTPSWNVLEPYYSRLQGKIETGLLTLSFPRPATVTYRLKSDGTLRATYEWRGGISNATMHRLEQ